MTSENLFNDPESIKIAAEKAAETVAEYIRKQPFQTVAVTFGVGLLAGLLLSKKNKE